jgi:hypothetical protein
VIDTAARRGASNVRIGSVERDDGTEQSTSTCSSIWKVTLVSSHLRDSRARSARLSASMSMSCPPSCSNLRCAPSDLARAVESRARGPFDRCRRDAQPSRPPLLRHSARDRPSDHRPRSAPTRDRGTTLALGRCCLINFAAPGATASAGRNAARRLQSSTLGSIRHFLIRSNYKLWARLVTFTPWRSWDRGPYRPLRTRSVPPQGWLHDGSGTTARSIGRSSVSVCHNTSRSMSK